MALASIDEEVAGHESASNSYEAAVSLYTRSIVGHHLWVEPYLGPCCRGIPAWRLPKLPGSGGPHPEQPSASRPTGPAKPGWRTSLAWQPSNVPPLLISLHCRAKGVDGQENALMNTGGPSALLTPLALKPGSSAGCGMRGDGIEERALIRGGYDGGRWPLVSPGRAGASVSRSSAWSAGSGEPRRATRFTRWSRNPGGRPPRA